MKERKGGKARQKWKDGKERRGRKQGELTLSAWAKHLDGGKQETLISCIMSCRCWRALEQGTRPTAALLRLWLHRTTPSLMCYVEPGEQRGSSWVDFRWINHFFRDKLLSVYRTWGLKWFCFWDDASCQSQNKNTHTQKAQFDPHKLL